MGEDLLIPPRKNFPVKEQKYLHEQNGNAHSAFTMEERHLGAPPFKH